MSALSNTQQSAMGLLGSMIGGLGYSQLGIYGTSGEMNTNITEWYQPPNLRQLLLPLIQEAKKSAKQYSNSFLDELRHEIKEWHGELR